MLGNNFIHLFDNHSFRTFCVFNEGTIFKASAGSAESARQGPGLKELDCLSLHFIRAAKTAVD